MSIYASNRKVTIDLAKLRNYSDICSIMKEHKITKYVYEFSHCGKTVKYGFSADNSRNYGERIYRQAGHLTGWAKPPLNGSSGSDMRFVSEDHKLKFGQPIDRMYTKITVTDLSNQTDLDCEVLERYLINTHITMHGEPPIGNKDNRTRYEARKLHNEKNLADLFDDGPDTDDDS